MDKKPAYIKIKETLLKNINDGQYNDNNVLPSERIISEMFNVSRMTARKAVDELVKDDIVVRIERKGAFVNNDKKRIVKEGSLFGLSQSLKNQGFTDIDSVIVKSERSSVFKYISKKLDIKVGDEILMLERIRKSNKQPMCVETAYLPLRIFPDIDILHDFTKESLYNVMDTAYGKKPTYATRHISVKFSDKNLAKKLDIPSNYPVFHINSTTYGPDDEVLEFLESYSRIDKFSFVYKLQLATQEDLMKSQNETANLI